MGRISRYDVENSEFDSDSSNCNEKDFRFIRNELYAKKQMSAEQFGIYLGGCKSSNDIISVTTIKRYIKKLCDMSGGRLNKSDFQERINGTLTYVIKPEFQPLLVVMFDTDYFGAQGKPKEGEDVEQRLRQQVAENIVTYLDEDMQSVFLPTSPYLNARIEAHMTEKIHNEIRGMLASVRGSEDLIRYQLMLELEDRLVALRRWMNEWNERSNAIRKEFASNELERDDAEHRRGKFRHKQIQDEVIDYILAVKEGRQYEYITEEEEVERATIYLAKQMYDLTLLKGHEFTNWLEVIDSNISNMPRYKYLMLKANRVFDKDDFLEAKTLESLDKIVRAILVSNEADLDAEQYERYIRMNDDTLSNIKEDILCKLDNAVNPGLDEKTLKEIIDIKDTGLNKQSPEQVSDEK